MTIKERVFQIIEKPKSGDRAGHAFEIFIVTLISLNMVAVIISSFNEIDPDLITVLDVFEVFSIVIFSAEYALRIWTSPLKYENLPYIRYIFSFAAIIDLLAFLPFYLPFLADIDLRYLRLLRLFRMLRIFKLSRYNNSFDIIGRALKSEKPKLLLILFILVLLMLFASASMYYIENQYQPDKFSNILSTLWWAVATLTTIGYGDVYPVTTIGKILGGVIAILGIGLIALPSGIISSALIQEASRGGKKHVKRRLRYRLQNRTMQSRKTEMRRR